METLKHDLISIRDLSREDIDFLLREAQRLKEGKPLHTLKDKKVASLFFEDSTRTRVSFETAAASLGGYVNGFSSAEGTSVKKGEPLADTVRMFAGYGYDALVMRHNLEGSARFAADVLEIPVINGGDGSNGHPSQTLLDLLTISSAHERIDGLKIALVGDLKYGRTVHSLLQALEHYDAEVWLTAPELVKMPEWRVADYRQHTSRDVKNIESLSEVVRNVDVLYMTRIQRERFPEGLEGQMEYERISNIYRLTPELLQEAKEKMIILHPLPRYKTQLENSLGVDKLPQAHYLNQAQQGLFMRQALLHHLLLGHWFSGKPKTVSEPESQWEELSIPDGTKKGERMVYRLDNGTVIDHIEESQGKKVLEALGLRDYHETPLILAQSLSSDRYGRKDVIGVQNRELTEQELSILALVSARARVNIVRDGRVVRKGKIVPPAVVERLVQCQNRKCVTFPDNYEHAPSKFYVEEREPLLLRCHYCEEPVGRERMKLVC